MLKFQYHINIENKLKSNYNNYYKYFKDLL